MDRPTAPESPLRHVLSGTELRRRRFRGPDGSLWEAVAAWDAGREGSFLARRVYFRHLTDPDVPHILGPSADVWSMSDEDLRAMLVRCVCARATHDPAEERDGEEGHQRARQDVTVQNGTRHDRSPAQEQVVSDEAAALEAGMSNEGLATAVPGVWLPNFDDAFELVEFDVADVLMKGRAAAG